MTAHSTLRSYVLAASRWPTSEELLHFLELVDAVRRANPDTNAAPEAVRALAEDPATPWWAYGQLYRLAFDLGDQEALQAVHSRMQTAATGSELERAAELGRRFAECLELSDWKHMVAAWESITEDAVHGNHRLRSKEMLLNELVQGMQAWAKGAQRLDELSQLPHWVRNRVLAPAKPKARGDWSAPHCTLCAEQIGPRGGFAFSSGYVCVRCIALEPASSSDPFDCFLCGMRQATGALGVQGICVDCLRTMRTRVSEGQ